MAESWNKSITVYVRNDINNETQWERHCFSHCFFKHILSSESDEKSRINGESYVVRIPCSSPAPAIKRGDIVVSGTVSDEISNGSSGNEILKKYGNNAFRVGTLSDNSGYPGSHIRIGN